MKKRWLLSIMAAIMLLSGMGYAEAETPAAEEKAFDVELELELRADLMALDADTENKVEQKVTELTAQCKASGAASQYDMARWFHDWLTGNAKYDESLTNFEEDGVLLKGTGVCQSYAYAFKRLLEKVGIECMIINSDAMEHSWNLVKIDNTWTHVDVTWDDPVPNGHENHKYFCLSDAEMKEDHVWNYSAYPAAYHIERQATETELPAVPQLMTETKGIDYSLLTSSGAVISGNSLGGGNTLLIYGKDDCPNTLNLLNELRQWKHVLDAHHINVLIVLENRTQVLNVEKKTPFTCTYTRENDYSMWEYLKRVNLAEPSGGSTLSLTYPLVVLQNRQGVAFYYLTGYISDPDKLVAAAISGKPSAQDPVVSNITAKVKKNTITLTWTNAQSAKAISKIEVQYATKKNFKKNLKTKRLASGKTKLTIKKLKKNTKYYIRIRYKFSDGKTSKWSSVKSVKTKK